MKETFSSRVRRLRNLKGYTQAKLAEKADISHTYAQSIEGGKRKDPGGSIIFKLSKALNVSMEYLITGKDPETPQNEINADIERLIDRSIDKTLSKIGPRLEAVEAENRALRSQLEGIDPEILESLKSIDKTELPGIRTLLGLPDSKVNQEKLG